MPFGVNGGAIGDRREIGTGQIGSGNLLRNLTDLLFVEHEALVTHDGGASLAKRAADEVILMRVAWQVTEMAIVSAVTCADAAIRQ